MKNYFSTPRGDKSIELQVEAAIVATPEGAAIDYSSVADFALARYEVRIRAKFAKMGLDLPDEALTVEVLRAHVERVSGLQIDSLTAEGVAAAVDKRLAAELSEKMGMEIATVFDAAALKEQVRAGVLAKLADGSLVNMVSARLVNQLRSVATFNRAGFDAEQRKKVLNRIYQKRYRRKHKQIWA